jgi:hypothetical protein
VGLIRLDDIIDGKPEILAKYDLIEIVRSSNREFELIEELILLEFPGRFLNLSRTGKMLRLFGKLSKLPLNSGLS